MANKYQWNDQFFPIEDCPEDAYIEADSAEQALDILEKSTMLEPYHRDMTKPVEIYDFTAKNIANKRDSATRTIKILNPKIEKIINQLPGGFDADWPADWGYNSQGCNVVTDGPDWDKGIRAQCDANMEEDDIEDMVKQAKEFSAEVAKEIELAKQHEKECANALKDGNLVLAKELLDQASERERQYGDNPTYQHVIGMLDKLIEEMENNED